MPTGFSANDVAAKGLVRIAFFRGPGNGADGRAASYGGGLRPNLGSMYELPFPASDLSMRR